MSIKWAETPTIERLAANSRRIAEGNYPDEMKARALENLALYEAELARRRVEAEKQTNQSTDQTKGNEQ